MSEKSKKVYKDERNSLRIAKERAKELQAEVVEETSKQLQSQDSLTIEGMLPTTADLEVEMGLSTGVESIKVKVPQTSSGGNNY